MNTNTVAQSDYAANAYTENVQQTTKKSAVTNGKTIGDPQLSENEYYGAAEPPVRCGESHLSGLTEPLRSL